MSPLPLRLAVLLAGLVLASGCGCSRPQTQVDAGPEAPLDAGEQDAGVNPGPADAGEDAGLPPELKILKVLPPRGGAAGGTQVLITGSGFMEGFATRATEAKRLSTLKFGSNPSLDFQVIDDGSIDAKVPAGKAGLANITLSNGNGVFVCTGCFTYFDELYLTGTSPKEGPLRGGNEVVLDGQGFTPGVHVLFGSRSSPRVTFVSSNQLKVEVPRGAQADAVDVTVYNKNGVGSQRRVYRYFEDLKVTGVAPLFAPLAGGVEVVLTGEGLTGTTSVAFGSLAATSFTVDGPTQLTAWAPAAAAAGVVDLSITTARDSLTVRRAFTYVDGVTPALHAVYPRLGPSAGANQVSLVGQGMDDPALAVNFGGQAATVVSQSPNLAVVTVPARGLSARKVDVTVSGTALNATLPLAYTYRLSLTALAPARGPSAGGTLATLDAAGLPPDPQVFLGSAQAQVMGSPTELSLQLTTPPGSGGAPSDLWVREASDPENEAVLPGAFTFEEPLALGRVQPERGAIAGGTLVTVRGAGFGAATVVSFGANRGKDLKVVDSHTLTCRTPKGDVGAVDVKVERLTEQDELPGGFSYFDPRNISGGLSGGPLVGTLNVSVIEATQGQFGLPVPLANVMLGLDATTPFQGQTDLRGQLTFSDPSLVKAQTVTVWKEGFETTTVTAVSSENLTVFVSRTGGGGPPSPPPPGPPPSLISGRVTGFKNPYPLTANESLEARVFVSQTSFYGGPPYRQAPTRQYEKWQVVQDGGEYLLFSGAGLRAAYAVLGVKNTQTGQFAPYLMGIRRGITTSPDNPAVNQDIVLDMHLDLTVPITIDSPISVPGALGTPTPAMNSVYSWLELGAEGFIPNPANWDTGTMNSSSVNSTGATLSSPYFPRLDGSNFIFLNEATGGGSYPVSYYFRRQPGDLAGGVTIGPMLPTPQFTQPTSSGLNGTIAWTVDPGPVPDIHQVLILKPTLMGTVTLWTVVLPGSEKQVVLPPPALQQLRDTEAGSTLFVAVLSSRSAKFSYTQWTYDSLSQINWSSYTIALSDSFSP